MRPNWKKILQIVIFFIVLRAFFSAWMWCIPHVFQVMPPASEGDLYKGVAKEDNPWLEPWQRWDTLHYQAIAERGFRAFDTAFFTPPLYPLLMQLFSPLFYGNTLASGLFISGLAFLGCLLSLYFLICLETTDENVAWRTVIFTSIFPTSFFFMAAYNESLFLFNVLLCFYFIKRKQWIMAGLFAGLSAFTRVPGFLLVIPLLWAAWEAWRSGDRLGWSAPLVAGIGSTLFPLYIWFSLHEMPFSILRALNQRGGYIDFPGINIIESGRRILNGQLTIENCTELAFTIFLVMMTIFIWTRLPRIYGIYSASLVIFFLVRFGSPQPLISMARYALEVFPVFILLAIWGGRPWTNRAILYLSLLGLLFFSAQFAIWGWVG